MNPGEWKEGIRRAVSASRIPKTVIAEQTGLPVGRIYTFVSRGHMRHNDVEKLEAWLQRTGQLQSTETDDDAADQPKSSADLLARDLHALADFISSPHVENEIKYQRFADNITSWHNGLAIYASMLKQKSNS